MIDPQPLSGNLNDYKGFCEEQLRIRGSNCSEFGLMMKGLVQVDPQTGTIQFNDAQQTLFFGVAEINDNTPNTLIMNCNKLVPYRNYHDWRTQARSPGLMLLIVCQTTNGQCQEQLMHQQTQPHTRRLPWYPVGNTRKEPAWRSSL